MDVKALTAILGALFAVVAYIPYFRDIFKGKTKPHLYTWVIWLLTLSTALAGIWYGGGGGYAALGYAPGVVLVLATIIVSLKYGTKNITTGDSITLIAAVLAIIVWWQLGNPMLSILMATAVDAVGYIPTIRKSYAEPWSETLSTWFLFSLSAFFLLLSIETFSVLTSIYLIMSLSLNVVLISLCALRRRTIPKPA